MTSLVPSTRSAGRAFRNWSGSVRFTPASCVEPDSEQALSALVRAAALAGRRVRVRGSGHSFVPLVETDGVLVSLERMSGIAQHDARAASVHAGTTLNVLGRELWARGLGMLNLGDINKQSIGGAVGTGTHGTGRTLGSISSQVEALTLVLADGQIRDCSTDQDPELFAAARVALGALGIITRLRVGLRPAYKLKLVKSAVDLDVCLAQCETLAQRHRHFEFYWFPHTRLAGLKCMDESDEPESQRALTYFNELVIENAALGLISRIARLHPAWAPSLSRLIGWSMKGDQGTMVSDCHRAFSSPRLVRFHEMEYELPADKGPDALRELAEFVDKKRVQVHFPVEYRYVRADDIWLSPFYQRDSAAISVHQYVGMDYEPYFRGAEAIFRSYGGRPHWGKMHSLGARELAPLYPRWDDFQRLREQLDPNGVFMNPLLQRLFVGG
jgi:FAD-linked oxidoreductase